MRVAVKGAEVGCFLFDAQLILSRIIFCGNVIQDVWDLLFEEQSHIPVRFKVFVAEHLVVDLVYDDRAIPKDFDGLILEKLRIDLDEFEKTQKRCIFTLRIVSSELRPEYNAEIGNGKRQKRIIFTRIGFNAICAEIAFHLTSGVVGSIFDICLSKVCAVEQIR